MLNASQWHPTTFTAPSQAAVVAVCGSKAVLMLQQFHILVCRTFMPHTFLQNGRSSRTNSFLCAGQGEADVKVYLRPVPAPALPPLLFLALHSLLPSYELESSVECSGGGGELIRRKGASAPDGAALATGVATLLRQFPPAYTQVQSSLSCQRKVSVWWRIGHCWQHCPACRARTACMFSAATL